MATDLGKLKVDGDAIENGDWVDDIPDLGDIALLVVGSDSIRYAEAQEKHLSQMSVEQKNDLSQTERRAWLANTLADCVDDWKNVVIDGEPVDFDRERLREMLLDQDYLRLRNGVAWACQNVGQRVAKDTKDAVGNSNGF